MPKILDHHEEVMDQLLKHFPKEVLTELNHFSTVFFEDRKERRKKFTPSHYSPEECVNILLFWMLTYQKDEWYSEFDLPARSRDRVVLLLEDALEGFIEKWLCLETIQKRIQLAHELWPPSFSDCTMQGDGSDFPCYLHPKSGERYKEWYSFKIKGPAFRYQVVFLKISPIRMRLKNFFLNLEGGPLS